MYCLYCHINKANGKRYFGVTGMKPERRWSSGYNYSSCPVFDAAIKKYGWDGFEHVIIADNLDEATAHEMEREHIARYRTTDPEHGYNQSSGGRGGRSGIKHTEEWKRKTSERLKGRVLTEEHKRKISEAKKGKPFSDEHRKHLSEARKGIKLSEEHRRHMSEVQKGKVRSEETRGKMRESKRDMMRPVYCIETDMTYESTSAAARALGVEKANLAATCKGKHEHVGGYHVRYAELL